MHSPRSVGNRRLALLLAGLVAFAWGGATELAAQEADAAVALDVDPATGVLSLRLGDIFADGGLRRAIHQGLPLRVGVRAELWQDRFFDSQRGVAEWKASVVFDPVAQSYQVEVQDGSTETVASLTEAGDVLQRRIQLPLRPREAGRYYYLAVIEMETLSLSDLEELQRWLRGDLAPAVAGDDAVEGALARGARRLFVRALGLPARRLRLRTPTFEIDDEASASAERVPEQASDQRSAFGHAGHDEMLVQSVGAVSDGSQSIERGCIHARMVAVRTATYLGLGHRQARGGGDLDCCLPE